MKAFIGLGSNLEQPLIQVQTALNELAQLPQTELIRSSSLYQSAPLGPPPQPDFINCVAEIDTQLAPEQLLGELQKIETAHHRVRLQRWGPRTLDLDILLYGEKIICTERLQIPHPEIKTREFVLLPLMEIEPNLRLPTGEFIYDLARICKKQCYLVALT
jgi:2-amino-4-hydroxy-6-hydroxymethyldihydropteridine diphosphokinase